ncbi:MAG: DinB family protein [Planctomycetota bacterium]
MRATPRALDALLAGLSAPWLFANEGNRTFHAHLVVGHLIHGERTDWIPRMKRILEHGDALAFEPFDRFARAPAERLSDTRELLGIFAELRAQNLATLEALRLTPDHLEKRGRHPELGPVTLGELLATWVVHDLDHLAQIARVMAKRYAVDVGPWKAYLPIVTR